MADTSFGIKCVVFNLEFSGVGLHDILLKFRLGLHIRQKVFKSGKRSKELQIEEPVLHLILTSLFLLFFRFLFLFFFFSDFEVKIFENTPDASNFSHSGFLCLSLDVDLM